MKPVSMDELVQAHEKGFSASQQLLAITIDDGWAGIAEGMVPELRRHNFPATLYLSTYYVESRRPVFKVAASYLFWKYRKTFTPGEDSCVKPVTLARVLDEDEVLAAAKALGSEWEQPLLEELCDFFGEPLAPWCENGKFFFLGPEQVRQLASDGLAIELHTHRHRFSEVSLNDARQEIEQNRHVIYALTGKSPRHFCFPRGEYRSEQIDILRAHEILSATTTRNELVKVEDSAFEWPRIVDSDKISDIEFEAELTGFMSLIRQFRPAEAHT